MASRRAVDALDEARAAATASVGQRLAHRLPWLALGLVGAMASAGLVASFEETLREHVVLAFFAPAIVYMADAIGTQAETVVIRGIALGIPLREVARRELVSGVIIGAVLALAFFLYAYVVWDDQRVAATIAIALMLSASIATAVAMMLPYLLASRGSDPAFGSGPMATVIQDILSLAVYFAVAAVLL